MTLYRKVMCSERRPDRSGIYSTNVGAQVYSVIRGGWLRPVQYWYELVEEPTVEEMTKIFKEIGVKSMLLPFFLQGALRMLLKLKGE